jgi:putative cardiolipin synthase
MKNALVLTSILLATLAAPSARADQVKFIGHGSQAFSAFTSLIDGARKSVDMVTFIFEPCDPSSQAILDSLKRASARGVKVRITLDGIGYSPEEKAQFTNMLGRQGAQVRFYNSNYLMTLALNMRVHEKLMVIDGDRYIAGGRNISDEYFGMSGKQNWVDSDVVVQGRSAAQAVASFENIWSSPLNANPTPQPGAEKPWGDFCGAKFSAPANARAKNFLATKSAQIMAAIPERSCDEVDFVSDKNDFGDATYADGVSVLPDATPGDGYMSKQRLARKNTAGNMIAFVNGARSRLDVTNYFYAPVGKEQDAFNAARNRRIAIDVITNQDMDDGPQTFRQAEEYVLQTTQARESTGSMKIVAVSSKGGLRDPNELSPKSAHWLLHSKLMVRDSKDTLVGSYNLDSRSYNTNLESYVVAHDCPLLAGDAAVEADFVRKVQATDKGRVPPKGNPSAAAQFFATLNAVLF